MTVEHSLSELFLTYKYPPMPQLFLQFTSPPYPCNGTWSNATGSGACHSRSLRAGRFRSSSLALFDCHWPSNPCDDLNDHMCTFSGPGDTQNSRVLFDKRGCNDHSMIGALPYPQASTIPKAPTNGYPPSPDWLALCMARLSYC